MQHWGVLNMAEPGKNMYQACFHGGVPGHGNAN